MELTNNKTISEGHPLNTFNLEFRITSLIGRISSVIEAVLKSHFIKQKNSDKTNFHQ